MDEKNTRKVLRLAPCPDYDTEGMESWLEDMAAEGLILEYDGVFSGIVTFAKGEPQKIKYRLDAAPESTSMFSDGGWAPDNEAQEINKSFGWEYIATRGDFYIYRSFDDSPREPNTDPIVQDMAVEAVERRKRDNLFMCLFWLIIYPLISIKGDFVLTMIRMKTWFFMLGAGILLWLFADALFTVIYLGKLRDKIINGTYDRGKDWRKSSGKYLGGKLLRIVLIIAWVCILLSGWSTEIMEEDRIPISEYTGTVPFATMIDFAGEDAAEYRLTTFGIANVVKEWRDILSPVNIVWDEIADIKMTDGTFISGGLLIDYHETVHPAIASRVAEEYYMTESRGKHFKNLSAPKLDADYIRAFSNGIGFPSVIIQDGKTVLYATFYQTSQTRTLTLNEWIAVLYESIIK